VVGRRVGDGATGFEESAGALSLVGAAGVGDAGVAVLSTGTATTPESRILLLGPRGVRGRVLARQAAGAPAQPQPNQQLDEAARLTFESAREAFVAGDYETALARFRQAYQLSSRPGLLYNIAQTLDRLRRAEETVAALRAYLEAFPEAPHRSEVEARIRVLEASLADRASEPEPEPEPDPQASSTTSDADPIVAEEEGGIGVLHPAIFLSVAGLALVGGGLAVWTGLETLSLDDDYENSNDLVEAERLYNDANTFQTVTNVLIFTSAGLAAGAVVLAILTDWDALGGGDDDATAGQATVHRWRCW